MESVSGGGERVVAEFGQDVAGLPDDLAGLRQGGAVAVLAVLGRVVGVVGADDRAWVLPASYTAQHSTGGPCRDRRPVHPSTGNATSSRPANRTRHARRCPRVGRGDLAASDLPSRGVEVVEGDLFPVDIQPAYDGHRDLLTLRRAHPRPPCELPTRSIVTRV